MSEDNGIDKVEGELEHLPTDMVLTIRDGMPYLMQPENDGGRVPDDFLILLAVARSWQEPSFRLLMLKVVHADADSGALDEIMHTRRMQ